MEQAVNDEVKKWVVDQLGAGNSTENILNQLLRAGWEEDKATFALETSLTGFLQQNMANTSGDGLPAEWRGWITENLLLLGDKDAVRANLMNAGFSAVQADAEIASILTDPCYQAAVRYKHLHDKLETVLLNHARVQQQRKGFDKVERVSGLSKEDFFEKYYLTGIPVVLTDFGEDWAAHENWTFDKLKSEYGDIEVEIQKGRDSEKLYEINMRAHKQKVKFSDFIDMVLNPDTKNDVYLTANNQALFESPLKAMFDDIGTLPSYLTKHDFDRRTYLWIGPAGTVTPLHHDKSSLFHINFKGTKTWKLISPFETPLMYNYVGVFSAVDMTNPDYDKYPKFKDVHVVDVTIKEGETLFLPLGWWHSVVSNEPCISLSMTSLDIENDFSYHEFDNRDWMG